MKTYDFISHPDKILWPEDGITKGDVLDYYTEIADYILPHLKDRPIVMHRFPDGIDKEGFYQKEAPEFTPDWVNTVTVQHSNKKVHYILIDSLESLLFVVNLASFEINAFMSKYQSLEYPEILSIDLDPEDLPFEAVVDAARIAHKLFDKLGLTHYCKTSGKRGLHLYLPLQGKYHESQVKDFANLLALLIQKEDEKLISLVRSPSKRQKKVYVDYLQNSPTKTMASPYSVRPVPGALVSTPLDCDELKKGISPKDFTIFSVPKRVKKKGDLFAPLLKDKPIDIEAVLKMIA